MRLGIFGSHFGLILGPKTSPKICRNLVKQMLGFLIPFLKVSALFRCLLAVFLAILRLSWTALDPNKFANMCVFYGFVKAQCLALGSVLGRILALLGRFWAQIVPQNGTQTNPNLVQKVVQNLSNFWSRFWLCFYRF